MTTPLTITDDFINEAQNATLQMKWELSDQGMTFEAFRAGVQPTIGLDDAVTVRWSGMWLCIETDGHCHT